MTKRWQLLLTLGLAALVLAACSAGILDHRGQDDVPSGRVLLWHFWTGEEGQALEQMLASYQALNPNVDILTVAIDLDRISERLPDRSNSGLGPDLILAEAGVIYELAQRGLIRDLTPAQLDFSDYLATAVSMVSDKERTYALPFAAHSEVLFYNRDLVQKPPETLAELMEHVAGGQVFAQNTSLIDSYWGVGAHDGRVIDDEGQLAVGLGGFENWLDFLATARTMPGFLFRDDQNTLKAAFIDGEAAYWVADSAELPGLVAAMGPERVGISLLPAGPNGSPASPFLGLDAFAFSRVSSEKEFALALDLGRFLTDAKNQLLLATYDLGRVPVNVQVRLTPALPENTLTVARQTRTAEPIRFVNQESWRELSSGALGLFEAYRQVADGTLDPRRLIDGIIEAFGEVYGTEPRVSGPADICPHQPGAIAVWHTLRSASGRLVEQMAEEFMAMCPDTEITMSFIPDPDIQQRFAQEAAAGGGPDLLYASSRWMAALAEQDLLMDLTELVTPHFLQQFLPKTVEAMRYRGRLYGIPESVLVLALIYNTTQVSEAPLALPDLARAVEVNRRAALPAGFFWSYWGLEPYGGFDFDSYTGEILEKQGLVAWLQALQATLTTPGMDYYFDASLAEDAFAFEEAAYLVSGPWSLPRLLEEVGQDRFNVAPLPNGPLAPGSPLLQVQGFMVNANAGALSADLGLAFGRFVNLPENQQRFVHTGAHVPASVTVDLEEYPELDSFRRQAKVATIQAETSNFVILEELGDQLYRDVLEGGADPVEAVQAFVDAVHDTTGAGRPQEE